MNNQPPYWEICRLHPFNDRFKVMYKDYSGDIQVGEILFEGKGEFNFLPEINWEVKEDDDITRFLKSLEWCMSCTEDSLAHRKSILEFHLANSSIVSDFLRVYWKDRGGEWNYGSWEFYKWDGYIEIVQPGEISVGEVKRFDIELSSLSDIISWLMGSIGSMTKGQKYCLWIDFGNR